MVSVKVLTGRKTPTYYYPYYGDLVVIVFLSCLPRLTHFSVALFICCPSIMCSLSVFGLFFVHLVCFVRLWLVLCPSLPCCLSLACCLSPLGMFFVRPWLALCPSVACCLSVHSSFIVRPRIILCPSVARSSPVLILLFVHP